MGKWLRRLFCKHHWIAIGEYMEPEKKYNHYRKRYIFKCKKCGKIKWGTTSRK